MDLKSAEIFSAGTWNDLRFDAEDLAAIVAAFEDLGGAGRVPLKFGHNDSQPVTDGQPALGWVERVWTDGKKLFADLRDIPSVVYEAIKKGLYKFVSVELLKDVEREGRTSPWVLDAVALLGADPPAVSNLADLQSLTLSRAAGLKFNRRVAFTLATGPQLNGGLSEMADSKDTTALSLKELTDKLADMANDVAKFKSENAELKAKVTTLEGDIEQREHDAHAAKVANHRAAITAKFEDAVKRRQLTPAARDLFYRMQGVQDDERVLACTDEMVTEYLKVNGIAHDSSHGFARQGDEDAGDEANVDQTVAARVADEMEKREDLTYQQAIVRVFRRDPKLGRAYIFQRG